MKKVLPYLLSCLLLFFINSCRENASVAVDTAALKAGFKSPSGTAKPKVYWWWLNGYMDRNRIVEELKAMDEAGIGGVDIFEIGFRPDGVVPAGPAFMSDSSVADIVFAINEAGKYDMEVGLNLSSSWNAGGSWVKPEHAAKTLYYSNISISSDGSEKKVSLPFPQIGEKDERGRVRVMSFKPDGKPAYSKEVAVLAIPAGKSLLDTADIINVSVFFDVDKEELNWKAPAGKWDIYRYVCSNTGEQLHLPSPNSHGTIIDHFDAVATENHFMYFIDRLKNQLDDFSKTALKNLYLASFEVRTVVWTGTMEETFRQQHGYDVHKFLPAIFNKEAFDKNVQEVFIKDLNFTISELMINNHYRKGKEIANNHGLHLISESGGPGPPLHNVPVEAIKALSALDIPRGEFWINHARYDQTPDSIDLLMLVKEIAAASNIYQRKITELEAFTSFQNWQEGPGDMKFIGDRAFCEGMNRPVIHGFTHNPEGMGYPGIGYYAGTHYTDRNTWWSKSKPFNDYLARISWVLQEADFFADVLYYYGDNVPNFATPKNTRFAAGSGYDYEIINTEILLDSLRYENGSFVLTNGARFKILATGSVAANNKTVLEKLDAFRKSGAIITDDNPASVLARLKEIKLVPDFDYTDKGSDRLDYMKADQPYLDFIHEQKGELDFYFVRNTGNEWISRTCLFRQQDKSPEIWHPVDGSVHPISVFNQQGEQIAVPLTFAPYESYFIVFEKTGRKPIATELPNDSGPFYHANGSVWAIQDQLTSIDGNWRLTFDPKWGGPGEQSCNKLESWTKSDIEGIKYFSGTVPYTTRFTFEAEKADKRVWLDLGKVARVSELWLNGQNMGITWTPPYRYDVTDVIKAGDNELKVEVVNTWSNRIIGDLTSSKKYTSTNLTQRGSRELTWEETPLLESGLLGPVTLYTARKLH